MRTGFQSPERTATWVMSVRRRRMPGPLRSRSDVRRSSIARCGHSTFRLRNLQPAQRVLCPKIRGRGTTCLDLLVRAVSCVEFFYNVIGTKMPLTTTRTADADMGRSESPWVWRFFVLDAEGGCAI
eukprot:2837241-Rhodomonas_salina.1